MDAFHKKKINKTEQDVLEDEKQKEFPSVLNRALILRSAMFWDSKKRLERIKSLILSDMNLNDFEDVNDFKVEELTSIKLLSLSKNNIIHLQPIRCLDTLHCLNINRNQIYDLSALAELKCLEELYASHNQIIYINPLASNIELKILNVFCNRIVNAKELLKCVWSLRKLEDLDIEENPVNSEQIVKELSKLTIIKINKETIKKEEVEKNISNILFFKTNNSFNNTQKDSSDNIEDQYNVLELKYESIDEEFEKEIAKNVFLKSEFIKKSSLFKQIENENEENKEKIEEMKLFKRKIKAMKDQLFTKSKKGDLLKEIFELEIKEKKENMLESNFQNKLNEKKKFYWDEIMIIETNEKYLKEDEEINNLLNENSNNLEKMKKELRSFNKIK